jgi:hypothetical protein
MAEVASEVRITHIQNGQILHLHPFSIVFHRFSLVFHVPFWVPNLGPKKGPQNVGPGGPPSARSRRAGAEDGRQTDTWRWGCHMSGVFMGI